MEQRLRPINAILALCTPGDLHDPALHRAGFEVAGLEVPVTTPHGTVVIDVLLAQRATSHLIACEGKSGGNVEVGQAQRYFALDAQAVVHAGGVDLPTRRPPTVEPLYVCLDHYVERIARGLTESGLSFPILTVRTTQLKLATRDQAGEALAGAIPDGGVFLPGGIPAYVPFDDHSRPDDVRRAVRAQLATLQSRKITEQSIKTLTEQTIPRLSIYGKGLRAALTRMVRAAVQQIAHEEPDVFEYRRNTERHDELVRVLRTPEDNDPRGRTQAWQANGRPRSTPRRRTAPSPDQLDLLGELGSADSVSGAEDDDLDREVGP